MSKSHANWRRTPEQAKAVYVYTLLDEHGLGRCAQWEIMVVSADDKPIAMWVERVRWDGHETGEFDLDTTDDPDCIGIGGNEISPWLHRGHIVELEFGEPTDIDQFIYAMRDDASEYFRVTIEPELDDAHWILMSLWRTKDLFGWRQKDLHRLYSLYSQVAARKAYQADQIDQTDEAEYAHPVNLDAKPESLFTRKSVGNLKGRSRHST